MFLLLSRSILAWDFFEFELVVFQAVNRDKLLAQLQPDFSKNHRSTIKQDKYIADEQQMTTYFWFKTQSCLNKNVKNPPPYYTRQLLLAEI